jgi:hypothetical protein
LHCKNRNHNLSSNNPLSSSTNPLLQLALSQATVQ